MDTITCFLLFGVVMALGVDCELCLFSLFSSFSRDCFSGDSCTSSGGMETSSGPDSPGSESSSLHDTMAEGDGLCCEVSETVHNVPAGTKQYPCPPAPGSARVCCTERGVESVGTAPFCRRTLSGELRSKSWGRKCLEHTRLFRPGSHFWRSHRTTSAHILRCFSSMGNLWKVTPGTRNRECDRHPGTQQWGIFETNRETRRRCVVRTQTRLSSCAFQQPVIEPETATDKSPKKHTRRKKG